MAADDLWSKEQINLSVESFRQEELLWNPRKGDYMKRAQRDRTMKVVSVKLNGKGMYDVRNSRLLYYALVMLCCVAFVFIQIKAVMQISMPRSLICISNHLRDQIRPTNAALRRRRRFIITAAAAASNKVVLSAIFMYMMPL